MKPIQKYSHCFVCGDKNEIGLKIDFFDEDGKAKTEFTPTHNFEGYKDILHGGIICTILDEVMIKSIIAQDILTVTLEMDIRFKKMTRIGEKLLFEGWIKEDKGKIIITNGTATKTDGTVVAVAKGKYFKVKDDMKHLLGDSLK